MSTTRGRTRIAVLIAALALLAATCGDDDGGDEEPADDVTTTDATGSTTTDVDEADRESPSATQPSESGELTTSDVGVTDSTISVGVIFPDTSVIGRDPGDIEAKWATIVDRINESGGINGRSIEMHFHAPNPIIDAESERVCTELTEDNEVFAAIGLFARTTADCYAEQHDTIVVSTFAISADAMSRYTAPGITLVAHPDRLVEPRIETLVDGGVLSDGMKVAVLGAGAAQPAHELYAAALEEAGVEIVADSVLLADGTDLVALNAEMDVFAEVWASSGAEAVVASTSLLSQALLIGYNNTGLELPMVLPEGTGVDPTLLRDNQGLDLAPFELATSLGDHDDATKYDQDLDGVKECVDNFEEASGEEVALDESRNNLVPTVVACQSLDIFVAIATAAGADLTTESFAAAADSYGPIEVTGKSEASIGSGKYDLDDSVGSISKFNPDTAQFEPVE